MWRVLSTSCAQLFREAGSSHARAPLISDVPSQAAELEDSQDVPHLVHSCAMLAQGRPCTKRLPKLFKGAIKLRVCKIHAARATINLLYCIIIRGAGLVFKKSHVHIAQVSCWGAFELTEHLPDLIGLACSRTYTKANAGFISKRQFRLVMHRAAGNAPDSE